jgi:hypothetical protein
LARMRSSSGNQGNFRRQADSLSAKRQNQLLRNWNNVWVGAPGCAAWPILAAANRLRAGNKEHSIGGARMYESRRGAEQSFVAGTPSFIVCLMIFGCLARGRGEPVRRTQTRRMFSK